MWFKKILVGVDFSDPSRQALRVAAALSADAGAELVLAHVWQPIVSSFGEPVVLGIQHDTAVRDAEGALLDWRHEAEKVGAHRVSTRTVVGTPWHELVRLLNEDPGFDLVVLGTHGRTGLRHALLGSVTEKVIRHAPCAALVVRD